MKRTIGCILLLVVILLCWRWYQPDVVQQPAGLDLSSILRSSADTGFAKVEQPREFSFPADHTQHPDYRIEWWYLTGNLQTVNNNSALTGPSKANQEQHQFGYQITLFRTALQSNPPQRQSNWASNQLWMGHLALSDINQQHHYQQQRLSRGALGLAGIQTQPFKIWLEDWQISAAENGDFPWQIKAKTKDFSIELSVNPLKPPVLQGEQGLSQKSAEPGNASYYYSFTRLQTTGSISLADNQHQVSGSSWLDREWSTSALGKQQSGWDWFSLQFDAGTELMFYRMRTKKGANDVYSSGKWIKQDGTMIQLNSDDVVLKPLQYWQADNGKQYPISWQLSIPKLSKTLIVTAAIKDQLMRTSIHYWEGAVTVQTTDSSTLIGRGYLEMTGY